MSDAARLRSGRSPRARGALLVDAMIAMSFFGVVLAGWLTLTTTKFKAMGEADRRFRATLAAESALAEARDGKRAPGTFAVDGVGGLEGEVATAARKDGLTEVVVTVRWREPGRPDVEESVRLATLARP